MCTELSLSKQLEHLSAVAHLALILYYDNGKEFMPTLLYQDLAIIVKNIIFCVAKAKIDNPDGKFYIVILGTDRLEELFGILRTMIGNDANLDIYQLALRLTGTTQVSNILAKYPHWDRSPRQLKLPAITRTSEVLPDTVDHIKPASWKGDVYVKNVTLLTAWRRGLHLVEEEFEFSVPIFAALENKGSHHILAPRGKLLFNLTPKEAGEDDSLDIEEIVATQHAATSDSPTSTSPTSIANFNELSANHVEIEDLFIEKDINDTGDGISSTTGHSKFDRYIVFEDNCMLKSWALSLYARRLGKGGPSSTDRLKHVQEVERYGGNALGSNPSNTLGIDKPLLVIQDPVATVVRCAGHLFLCIGEVNGIKIGSESSITVIPQTDLREMEKVVISIQVLGLWPATSNDDSSLQNDWRTYQIKETTLHILGQFVQPIDPKLVSRGFEQMFYLFEGSVLVGLAATILGQLISKNVKELGCIAKTDYFLYRETTGIFFIAYLNVVLIFVNR